MRFRSRPLVADDLEQAFALIWRRVPRAIDSPVATADVIRAWQRLLSRHAIATRIVESPDLPRHANMVTLGISAFVHETWLADYLRAPFPYPGRFIIDACAQRDADRYLLTDMEVATANSSYGLSSLTLGIGWAPERLQPGAEAEGYHRSVRSFLEAHDGYRFAQLVSECLGPQECCLFLGGGSWETRHVFSGDRPDSPDRHIIVGMTQAESHQMHRASAVTAPLFVIKEPRYCFDARQQTLLLRALDHVSDKDLADVLGIGTHALRRRWRRIFRRIEALQPLDDPIIPPGLDSAGKRARALLRLKDEMHELRPHTFRRLLKSYDEVGD